MTIRNTFARLAGIIGIVTTAHAADLPIDKTAGGLFGINTNTVGVRFNGKCFDETTIVTREKYRFIKGEKKLRR